MLFTIGHSTHGLDEFVGLLKRHGIQLLADIRTVPRSRRNPQFNLDVLPGSLAEQGIDHQYLKALGGLRHVQEDSINTAWRNDSFRGYADYMQTDQFWGGIDELEDLMETHVVAVMCAEALWWRCHRSMVADAMLLRGHEVTHIMPDGRLDPATMHDFAVAANGRITYPATNAQPAPGVGESDNQTRKGPS